RDGVDVEPAALRGDPGEKQYLEEQVPELVGERVRTPGVDRVQDLVALFEDVRPERFGRLLPVPGALAPECFDESDESRKSVRHERIIASERVRSRSIALKSGSKQ